MKRNWYSYNEEYELDNVYNEDNDRDSRQKNGIIDGWPGGDFGYW